MQHYSINNVSNGLFAVYEHATRRIVHEAKTREGCQQWIDSCVLYLRKEANDEGWKVVVYYKDPAATDRVALSWGVDRPTRRNKWVMLNCVRYRACWLPDLPENT
jgi:hypothetical protein